VGIVVNRVHTMLTGEDIFRELDIEHLETAASVPIHIGGPVHVGEIFVLHGPPFTWRGCLNITPELGMSNTIDIIEAIATDRGPESYIISLGCAGWGPGQLEMEIQENVWLTGPVFEDILFKSPVASRWETAVRKIGVNPEALSGQVGHA
jgi:putative transcriptional regulator